MKTYSLEDGKYEVDRHEDYGTILDVRRHGEHWEAGYEDFRFSKFIHAMLNHIDSLESKHEKDQTQNPSHHLPRENP